MCYPWVFEGPTQEQLVQLVNEAEEMHIKTRGRWYEVSCRPSASMSVLSILSHTSRRFVRLASVALRPFMLSPILMMTMTPPQSETCFQQIYLIHIFCRLSVAYMPNLYPEFFSNLQLLSKSKESIIGDSVRYGLGQCAMAPWSQIKTFAFPAASLHQAVPSSFDAKKGFRTWR